MKLLTSLLLIILIAVLATMLILTSCSAPMEQYGARETLTVPTAIPSPSVEEERSPSPPTLFLGKAKNSPSKSPENSVFGLRIEENPLPSLPGDLTDEQKIGAGQFLDPKRDSTLYPFKVMIAMGLKPGDTIADIGSGPGFFTFRFSRVVGEKGKVYAVDINKGALEVIEKIKNSYIKKGDVSFKNIVTVNNKVHDICLPENSLDFVFMCQLDLYAYINFYIPYSVRITDPNEAREIVFKGSRDMTISAYKALKKDGKLVVMNVKRDHHPWADPFDKTNIRILGREDAIDILARNGFELERSESFVPEHDFMIFRKRKNR